MISSRTAMAPAVCAVLFVCTCTLLPALRASKVEPEPEQNCAVWIEPPDGALRIGIGQNALCGPYAQPTSSDSCTNVNLTTQHCWCDEGCDMYSDCCYDSRRDVCYQSADPFPPGDVTGAGVTTVRRATEQCVRTWIFELTNAGVIPTLPDYRGHWLIAGCPAGYKNQEINARCDSEQDTLIGDSTKTDENVTNEIVHSIPVKGLLDGEWMHYKNMYCAFCRGVQLKDVVPWILTKFDCKKLTLVIGVGIVEYDCPTFAYRFTPPDQTGESGGSMMKQPRPCIPDVVEDCPVEDEGNSTTKALRSWAAELCSSYEALIRWGQHWYKNPHCCICHGLISDSYCFKPNAKAGSANAPLSIPFNFLPLAEDAIESVALILECPQGFNYSFNAQQCVPSGGVSGLLCDKPVPVVKARVLVSVDETNVHNKTWVQTFVSLFVDSLSLDETAVLNIDDKLHQLDKENLFTSDDNETIGRVHRFLSFDIINMSMVWEQFNNLSAEMASLQKAIDSHASVVGLLNVELTESCTGDILNLDECAAITRLEIPEVRFYIFDGTPYMYQNDAPVLYQADNTILQMVYTLQNTTSAGVSRTIITCNATKDLICYHITLPGTSKYRIQDGVMEFNIEGKSYESTEYLILSDGSAQVCKDKFQDPWFAYSVSQYIINVLGTSLSSLALVLTFVTYCTFSSLRTVPGKATMHFVAALFAGEILLLVGGSIPRDSTGVCTFMAVVSHYIWLACFFWMTALGFDVSRTFSMRTGPRLAAKSGHALLWMCVFSWGAPAVVLIICLPLHFIDSSSFSSGFDFNYGYDGVCWIRPEMANLLAFGLPVMASLFTNCILFVKTILGLRASKRITSFIERDKSTMQRASDEFVIYLKVSVLMGLTWIWFFIAAFTGVTAILYVAITLNALHGCFVFIAFACNRRVWAMWRRQFGRERGASTSSRSGTLSAKNTDSTAATTTKSSVAMLQSPVSGSPVPERVGLNGTRL